LLNAQDADLRIDQLSTPQQTISVEEQDPLMALIMDSQELTSMISATLPNTFVLTNLFSHIHIGLTPSSTTTTNAVLNLTEQHRSSVSPKPVTIHAQIEMCVLSSMPAEIIRGLVEKYIHKVVPQYPFLGEVEIWQHLHSVTRILESAEEPLQSITPSIDFLIIYLVLAISITLGSAKGGHESRCISFSGSLFEEGIQHLTSQANIPSDLVSLQINLLVLLYATINPRSANVWILSGAAMRSCLVSFS
jgi:hypothetical protein